MSLSKIAFVGDVHGNLSYLSTAMEDTARLGIDTIIQVGDFWLYDDLILEKMGRVFDRIESQFGISMTVHFIDGNHENYNIINPHGDVTHFITDRLIYHPRGDVFEVHNVVIGCLGGAVSIDQEMRLEGRDWWRNEAPSFSDLQRAVDNFRDTRIDVLVTHDIPDFALSQVYSGGNPNLYDSDKVRKDLNVIVEESGAPLVVHGHWHIPSIGDYEKTRVVSLNRDNLPGHVCVTDGHMVLGAERHGLVHFPIADIT